MSKADKILLHTDVLLALRQEKLQVRQQIKESSDAINKTTQRIFAPIPSTTKNVSGFGKLIRNGIAIYQGFKMARSFMGAASSMFRKKK